MNPNDFSARTDADRERALAIVQSDADLIDVTVTLRDMAARLRPHVGNDPRFREAVVAILRARLFARRAVDALNGLATEAWGAVHGTDSIG